MPDDTRQIAVRLPRRLLSRIDERAAKHKLSRNAWIELALERLVSMPDQTTQRQERF